MNLLNARGEHASLSRKRIVIGAGKREKGKERKEATAKRGERKKAGGAGVTLGKEERLGSDKKRKKTGLKILQERVGRQETEEKDLTTSGKGYCARQKREIGPEE